MSKISNNNFDLKKDNYLCLKIIEIINDNIYLKKKYAEPFNLIKIFYNELIKYSTNILLIKNSPFLYTDKVDFPYLNSNFISKPKKINHIKKLSHLEINNFFLKDLIFNSKKKTIFLSNNLHIKKEILLEFVTSRQMQLIQSTNIHLPDYEYQMKNLEILLKKIMRFLNLKNQLFISNFLTYAENILLNDNRGVNFRPNNSILIVGSNENIKNRTLSSKFLQNKSNKVISINHSNYPFYIYKEPVRNIEYSFCTDYISYGNLDFSKKIKNKIFSTPKFHFMNHSDFRRLKKKDEIKKIQLHKDLKYLYAPNMLNGNIRYGPFRDIDDNIYYKFQNDLLSVFKNTKIKTHPKGKNLFFSENVKISNSKFEKIFDEYDVFIFDYFSTPFSRAIATNKPIIYFDIGLRNLEKNVLDIIKKRVYYCKIVLNRDHKSQLQNFLVNILTKEEKKTNLFTEKFSINNKNKNINMILKEII